MTTLHHRARRRAAQQPTAELDETGLPMLVALPPGAEPLPWEQPRPDAAGAARQRHLQRLEQMAEVADRAARDAGHPVQWWLFAIALAAVAVIVIAGSTVFPWGFALPVP